MTSPDKPEPHPRSSNRDGWSVGKLSSSNARTLHRLCTSIIRVLSKSGVRERIDLQSLMLYAQSRFDLSEISHSEVLSGEEENTMQVMTEWDK